MDSRASSAFGHLLRTYRRAATQSQETLAERTGLSVRGISDLERGVRKTPHLKTVRMLADGLGLGPDDRAALLAAARPASPARPPDRMTESTSVLPQSLTSLIGRAREVSELTGLLGHPAVRLLTLIGPGGVGKSRLALAVANEVHDHVPDGVHVVELASLTDPQIVPSALGQQLNIREAPGMTVTEEVIRHLRARQAVLVLDNFEHVLPAGRFVAALLTACPHVRVLATSRAPLHIRGEWEWPVQPLHLPDPTQAPTASDVARSDAVRLFLERVSEVRPDFALTRETAPVVAAICRHLDGLPLALELAAARMRVLSASELQARLEEHRLPVLTGGAQDLPPRQQTMRTTIAWSYDLLEAADQALFRRLSVFAGGWTLEAAEAVTNIDGTLDVLDGITALMNGSLIRHQQGSHEEHRFEMLETVREYGLEQLVSHGEESATRDAHTAWLLDLVEQAAPGLVGADQAIWLQRLEEELGNLRAALNWTLEHGDPVSALRLAATAWLFWFERGRTNEGRNWLDRALAMVHDGPSPVRAMARHAAGTLAATQCDYGPADTLLQAALSDWQALDEKPGIARTLHTLGTAAVERNDNRRAIDFLEQALALYDSPPLPAEAPWVALAVSHLACAVSRMGEHERAVTLAEQAIRMQQEAGSHIGYALAITLLADIALDWGNYSEASALYREGLAIMWSLGDQWHLLYALTGSAIVTAELDPPEKAARLLSAQLAAHEAYGNVIPPRRRPTFDAAVAKVRAALGEEAFSRCWKAGIPLGLDGAVTEILAEQPVNLCIDVT